MISNETIKRRLRKGLMTHDCDDLRDMDEVVVNNIKFNKVKREGDKTTIHQITLNLDDITGVELDALKLKIDTILEEMNVEYSGLLLEI